MGPGVRDEGIRGSPRLAVRPEASRRGWMTFAPVTSQIGSSEPPRASCFASRYAPSRPGRHSGEPEQAGDKSRPQVPPKGRSAGVLAIVMVIVDVAGPLGLGLLASQVAVFGFTAFVSFQWPLWAQIYARFIWPRIGAQNELETARPLGFAQFLGFVITALALILLARVDGAGYRLTALAFVLAALHASTRMCLGCRPYVLTRRRQSARP